jgi:hypothetical protein
LEGTARLPAGCDSCAGIQKCADCFYQDILSEAFVKELSAETGRLFFPEAKPLPATNLDWTDALVLEDAWHQAEFLAGSASMRST